MDYPTRLQSLWTALTKAVYAVFAIIAFFLIMLLATKAFAQGTPDPLPAPVLAPAMGVMDMLKTNFLSPAGLAGLIASILGIAAKFAWATEKRKRIIALAVKDTFAIVEDIGNEIDGDDGFDKVARGLRELDAYLLANGWRPANALEQEQAKKGFQVIHGNEVAKAKVLVAAATAVAENVAAADPSTP